MIKAIDILPTSPAKQTAFFLKLKELNTSKLNNTKVMKLLNSGISQVKIAKLYDVRQSTISQIKLYKTWGHVKENTND